MAVNKVVLGSETLLDLTGDTATAADVAEGKTFHLASGVQATGTASGGGSGVSVFYGTCATAAATAAKAVVCEEFTSSDLVEGAVINVKFTNAQTYNGAPTLNVNGTGAKNIKRVGTTNAARYEWSAGEVLQFVYDGTYWMLTDGGIATTTYYGVTKLATSATSTSTATALTPASLNNFAQNMVSGYPVFSTSSTYAVGDRVRYDYYTYECTNAITTAGAWDASDWVALDPLQEQIDAIAVPSASSTTPAMDGTAAVGTSASYARADHVHPTDTSRVAETVTVDGAETKVRNYGSTADMIYSAGRVVSQARVNASGVDLYAENSSGYSEVRVTPSGVTVNKLTTPATDTMPTTKKYVDDGLSAKQATLVSGTNIKTINGESLLGSGNITISGGSSGGLLVTFTSDGDAYTADKTFGEIAAALNAGINPVFKFDDSQGTFASIVRFNILNNGTCYMKLSHFFLDVINGGQSDYPSYTSGN